MSVPSLNSSNFEYQTKDGTQTFIMTFTSKYDNIRVRKRDICINNKNTLFPRLKQHNYETKLVSKV